MPTATTSSSSKMVKVIPAEISPVAPVASRDSTEEEVSAEGAFLPPLSNNSRTESGRAFPESRERRHDGHQEDPEEDEEGGFGAPPPFPGVSKNNLAGNRKRTLMAVSASAPVEDDSSSSSSSSSSEDEKSSSKPSSSQIIHRIKGGGGGGGDAKSDENNEEDSGKKKIHDDAMLLASLSDLDKKTMDGNNDTSATASKGKNSETKLIQSPPVKSSHDAHSTASTPRRSNVNAHVGGRVIRPFILHPKPSPKTDLSPNKRAKLHNNTHAPPPSSSAVAAATTPRKSPEVTPDHRPKAGSANNHNANCNSKVSTPSRNYSGKSMGPPSSTASGQYHPHQPPPVAWNPHHPHSYQQHPTHHAHPYGAPAPPPPPHSYPYMGYPPQYGVPPPPPGAAVPHHPHHAPPHPYYSRPYPPSSHPGQPHYPPTPSREWATPSHHHPPSTPNPFSPPRMNEQRDRPSAAGPPSKWDNRARGGGGVEPNTNVNNTQPLYHPLEAHSSSGGKSHVVPSEEMDVKKESGNCGPPPPPASPWYGNPYGGEGGGRYNPSRPEGGGEAWGVGQHLHSTEGMPPSHPPHHDPRYGPPPPTPSQHVGRGDAGYNPYYPPPPPPANIKSVDPRDMNNEAFRVSTDENSPRNASGYVNPPNPYHSHPPSSHQHPPHLEYPTLDTPPRGEVHYADEYYHEGYPPPSHHQHHQHHQPHSHTAPPQQQQPPSSSNNMHDPYEPHPHDAPPPFPRIDYSTPPPIESHPYHHQHPNDPYGEVPAVVSRESEGPPVGFGAGSGLSSKSNHQFHKGPRSIHSEPIILRKKFSWRNYPELEEYLIANRTEYLRHSALNYTAEQKHFNNRLTEGLLELAAKHNYIFDESCFNFVAVRDRIRCYYKSYVQSSKKRGVVVGFPKVNPRDRESQHGGLEGSA